MTPDRSVLRKVLTTAALGGVTFLISNTFKQPVLWSVSLSIFIGGVALVVQYLAQFENRLREATSTFRLVEDSASLRDPVMGLVRNSTRLDPKAPELMQTFARSEIVRVSEFVRELVSGGEVTYDGEDRDWLLALTRNLRSTLDTTSMTTARPGGRGFVDETFWDSDLGMRYLEAQRHAVQRGVKIRRIFVFDQPELAEDPEIRRLCRLQQEFGVVVRTLLPDTIPGPRRRSLFDFTLFDNVVSYELTGVAPFDDGTTILNTRLVLQPSRLQHRIQRFRDLWESARDFT